MKIQRRMKNKVSSIHRRIEHFEDIRKILSGSCLTDKWEEEDTAEMLVMMENALVNADEEQKVQVVQEIGPRVMIVVEPAVASMHAVGTIAELRFHQKENVYQAL